LSLANYNALLISWSAQSLQSGVVFSGGSSKYSAGTAATARQHMITSHGWTITDGGQYVPVSQLIIKGGLQLKGGLIMK